MKYFLVILTFTIYPIYSQSLSELSLINEETGEGIHFYDSPSVFLDMVNADSSSLTEINLKKTKEYRGDNYYLKVRYIPSDLDFLENEKNFYIIDTLRVSSGFKTIRGIGVGDTQENVISKYPECRLYADGSYYWQNLEWTYEPGKQLPDEVAYMTSYWDFGKRKRNPETKMDIIYGFRFYFDSNKKVDEMEISFLLTAP